MDGRRAMETGLQSIAAGSDSIYCDGHLLNRGIDYTVNLHTGRLTFSDSADCDSLVVTVFRLPEWMTAPAGNPVAPGERLFRPDTGPTEPPIAGEASRSKITVSGNKSFSFNIGRAGEGRFSQGLNLDFDALPADNLRIRGSISDRLGASDAAAGEGGTTTLSELDKYFFEIAGSRVEVRGGDIETMSVPFLRSKRIKGVRAGYTTPSYETGLGLGRPAGRFVSRRMSGVDGRQGPYQVFGDDGAPTGIAPGSETVYLDGRKLESGADKHYLVDYALGRITFTPRILITALSRIEIDFEAVSGDYEQAVYDGASRITFWNGRMTFGAGGRRETDEKNHRRFTSLSPEEILILTQAGDSALLAHTDGARPDSGGEYRLVTDSAGVQYYLYVGSGEGDYRVTFSFVGEGKGDYIYSGGGIYRYIGNSAGAYLPIVYLSLPARNDFFFTTLEAKPYAGGTWRIEYQGNDRDRNLFSTKDDDDNLRSLISGRIIHEGGAYQSVGEVRYRQRQFDPAARVDSSDNSRLWAISPEIPEGDELHAEVGMRWHPVANQIEGSFGYRSYKDNLRAQRFLLQTRMLQNSAFSPHAAYRQANSHHLADSRRKGLFQKYNAGMAMSALGPVRLVLDFDREFIKDAYLNTAKVEAYTAYQGTVFYRNTAVVFSRRTEFSSAGLGAEGPLQHKVELTSEETVGRLNLSLAGTWFEQKRLDSDRGDRSEHLFMTSVRYAPSSAWITLQAEYRQNRQDARSEGFRYLQVTDGEGDYRYEDGRYLPDPDGNYIRITEERGTSIPATVGEKNHTVLLYPGRMPLPDRYQTWLSQVALRLRTEVSEEMPGRDRRTLSWVFPWTSRSGIEYVRRTRRERYSALLFPMFNFYVINLTYSGNFEEQESGGQLFRSEKDYDVEVKNRLSPTVLSSIEYARRITVQSGSVAVAGALTRNTYSTALTYNPPGFQVTPRVGYVTLRDYRYGGRAEGVITNGEIIWRQLNRGEVRLGMEFQSLTESVPFSQPEYLVTDGKRFGKSGEFSLLVNYDIGKSFRLTANVTDRVYEGRPAEFVGRGELIARF